MAMSSCLKFSFLAVLLLCNGSLRVNCLPQQRSAYKDGHIVLGGLFDLHQSAGNNNYCGDILGTNLGYAEAMVFAIESINENNTLLPNVTLGFDLRDYCLRPAMAVETAYELVVKSDHRFSLQNCTNSTEFNGSKYGGLKEITGVVGPMDSASAIMVSSLFEIAHIPSISPLATSVELSTTLYSHFYRTVAPDNWRASLLADTAQFFNWTYVGAVALDDSFGRYGIWGIEKEADTRENLCIAFKRFVPRANHLDSIRKIVFDLKRSEKVTVVFIWLYGEYARYFMDEVVNQDLTGRTWIFTDGTTPGDPFFTNVSFAGILNGSFGILPKARPSEQFQKYLANLAKRNFTGSTHAWWKEYWIYMAKNNKLLDTSYPFSVPIGSPLTSSPYISYTIDAVYAFAHALHNMYTCKEPHSLLTGGKCPTVQQSKIKGDELHFYLRNVSFQGLTGTIEFDKNGDPLDASYDIVNFKSTGKDFLEVRVGWWARKTSPRLHLNLSNITWNSPSGFKGVPLSVCSFDCKPGERRVAKSPCCWECVNCPRGTINSNGISSNCSECPERQKPNDERTKCVDLPQNNLSWNTSAIAVTCTAVTGLLLTILCIVVFVKYRNSPIVKASNQELSFLLLIVVALLFVLAFLYLLTPTDLLCSVINIWRYIVHTLCVSILLLKSRKIVKAFRLEGRLPNGLTSGPKKRKKSFLFKGQRLHLLGLLSVQVILIVAWTISDPPSKETIVRPLQYVFIVCKPFRSIAGEVLLAMTITTVLLLALACIYYAFKGRKIPENFNEARYIGFSMYIVLLSSAAYYPVEFGLEGWYVGIIGGVTTLVSSFALLGCMFGPKVYVIFFSPEQNTREAISTEIAKYSLSTSAATAITSKASRVTPQVSPESSI